VVDRDEQAWRGLIGLGGLTNNDCDDGYGRQHGYEGGMNKSGRFGVGERLKIPETAT
jgi:hypothetical protein